MTPAIRVRVESLAAGGDGVGRLPDGRAVFVPRVAPGDLVALGPVREHRTWARAEAAEVVEPGPDRVTPRCEHYDADRCGGCQWQHLSAPAQRRARAAIVGEALRRIGRLDVPDPEVEAAPSDWGYRHRLTLHQDAAGRIGLHPLDRPSDSFDLHRCEIAHEDLNRLWRAVDERRDLLPRPLGQLTLRRGRDGTLQLVAMTTTGRAEWPGAQAMHEALREVGVEVGLWVAAGRTAKVDGRRKGRVGIRPSTSSLRPVAGPSGATPLAFEQVAPAMGDRIRQYAVAGLGGLDGRHAWDLYAGAGETSALLVAGGATVESVEVAPTEQRGVGASARRHVGRVEEVVGRLARPDVVITNPPRTGMDPRAVDGMAAAGPARIAYVSCDPATLARDLRRLGDYRPAALRAFDLFPQTAHVETVAVLERR